MTDHMSVQTCACPNCTCESCACEASAQAPACSCGDECACTPDAACCGA